MVQGCISVFGTGNFHIWKGTINPKMYKQVVEQHLLPSRWHLFQGKICIFQQDNAGREACSPDFSPTENIWHIMKPKYDKENPELLSS